MVSFLKLMVRLTLKSPILDIRLASPHSFDIFDFGYHS